MQKIEHLNSGGLITNYYCTNRCRHCLYSSGPDKPREYMNATYCAQILDRIASCGCPSVHIGGGEPFMNPEGLKDILVALSDSAVSLDYVETNGIWYRDEDQAVGILDGLKAHGLRTLLVSISPFHNEYVPLQKIEGVLKAADRCGVGIFPWQRQFIADLQQLDTQGTYTLEEMEEVFGEGYLPSLLRRFGITLRGRALRTFKPYLQKTPLEAILRQNAGFCEELLDTSHFHIDLYGNYIPGLCVGLSILFQDIGTVLTEQQYPLLTLLLSQGIGGLLSYAINQFGFSPQKEYVSKCDLCTHIRTHLIRRGVQSRELQPTFFYDEELSHWAPSQEMH